MKRCGGLNNETELNLPEPPVHSTKPKPTRITSYTNQRRTTTRASSLLKRTFIRNLTTLNLIILLRLAEAPEEHESKRQTEKYTYPKAVTMTLS
ncbi:hypothetical protein F2Q69_00022305 [Brassica cretica]|uniref:Uncharacterized protein n=1 Tax=Brassica cretica TaxID=69181 RepID=A0A8S9Q3I6_BRACR|nr:hypothetical protein F2Q69_00022305 [Brassica cretica]